MKKNIAKLTRGFIATKGTQTFELKTEVFALGIYVFTYALGKIVNQTARKNVQSADNLILSIRSALEKEEYTFQEKGYHKVYKDPKTLKYKTSI